VNRFLHRLKTRTGVIASLGALVVGFIFCQLGLWQLDRADEKRAILSRHTHAMQLEPLRQLAGGNPQELLYRQFELRGTYDQQHQFLIDNRTFAGQAGFEVVTPFYLPGGEYVLVNRGWIGHAGDRKVSISTDPGIADELTLQGLLTTPSRGFILGDSGVGKGEDKWPLILQFVDYGTIAAKLDKIPAIDAVIIAASGQPGSYRYNWRPVAGGVEKHLGYAFQWFAMLTALIALYLYLMVFKKHNE